MPIFGMLLEGKSLQKAMLLQKADSDSSLDSRHLYDGLTIQSYSAVCIALALA